MSSTPAPRAAAAAFLPGPVPDRTRFTGWQHWRRTRDGFQPAERLSLRGYRALAPREQRLYDLHRLATHSSLPLQATLMSRRVAEVVRARIEDGAFSHKAGTRTGVMVNGPGAHGKTETVCEAVAGFEDEWLQLHHQLNPDALAGTRDLFAPVAYVRCPVRATPISACQRILDFYGADYRRMRLEDLVRTVQESLFAHGTKALVIDDITRLKLHREADQDVLDLLRELMSMPVTLILVGVGIPASGLLRDGRRDPRSGQWLFPPVRDRGRSPNGDAATQHERRFDLIDLDAFSYDSPEQITAWTTHLSGLEANLRLLRARPGMLTTGDMPEYLYGRTGGVVGLLEKLLQIGCRRAIATGTEHLTQHLLDTCAVSPTDLPHLDAASGEQPHIPAPPARTPAARRARNTVFDDSGPRAAAGNR